MKPRTLSIDFDCVKLANCGGVRANHVDLRAFVIGKRGIHNTVGIRIGKWMQQCGIDDVEHRSGCADPESKRENGCDRNRRMAEQRPDAKTYITADLIEGKKANGCAILLLLDVGISKLDSSLPQSFGQRNAGLHQVFGMRVHVESQFCLDVAVGLGKVRESTPP
jgi:hypothetical protein